MNINTVKGDSIETLLRQLGSSRVTKVRGLLYFITFKLNEQIEVSYVYNINAKNQYFLQRIKPYPLPKGVFTDEYEIVSFIGKDLNKFQTALNSRNFISFLEATNKLNTAATNMENLFLNYNVNSDDILRLNKELDDILNEIEYCKSNSKNL